MNHESKRPVTIEDLLHLKRAERPPAEFWTNFDRDLRAKQLAALVAKRPWWRQMPRVFAGFSRYYLPIGATAVLAVTFFSVRDYQAVVPAAPASPAPPAPAMREFVAATALTSAPAAPEAVAAVAVPAAGLPSAETTVATEFSAASAPMAVVPVVALLRETPEAVETPSARSIKANLATAEALDPVMAGRFLAAARGFESRGLPARASGVGPLGQIAPSEARRARQLVSAMPVSSDAYSASSERIARRLSDERLYESIRRFGASGNQLNLKF